jgi:hypothetical protein
VLIVGADSAAAGTVWAWMGAATRTKPNAPAAAERAKKRRHVGTDGAASMISLLRGRTNVTVSEWLSMVVMVESSLKNGPLCRSDPIGCDISEAIYRCDQTTSAEGNLLHDGLGRYFGVCRPRDRRFRRAIGHKRGVVYLDTSEFSEAVVDLRCTTCDATLPRGEMTIPFPLPFTPIRCAAVCGCKREHFRAQPGGRAGAGGKRKDSS